MNPRHTTDCERWSIPVLPHSNPVILIIVWYRHPVSLRRVLANVFPALLLCGACPEQRTIFQTVGIIRNKRLARLVSGERSRRAGRASGSPRSAAFVLRAVRARVEESRFPNRNKLVTKVFSPARFFSHPPPRPVYNRLVGAGIGILEPPRAQRATDRFFDNFAAVQACPHSSGATAVWKVCLVW